MKRNIAEIKPFIFFSEEPFITYFGQNYESTVLQANRRCIPVIGIINANGTRSAIPLERANSLLEKYYRLKAKEVYHANLNEMAPVGETPQRTEPTAASPAEAPSAANQEETFISGAA